MEIQKKINWWWVIGGVILLAIILWIIFSSGSAPVQPGNISPPPSLPS